MERVVGLIVVVALSMKLFPGGDGSFFGTPDPGVREEVSTAPESAPASVAAAAPAAMPIVSRGAPAYGSQLWFGCAAGCYRSPDNAVDADYATKFATVDAATPAAPQWLALDLNGKGVGPAYVVLYSGGSYNYYYSPSPGYGAITDFSLQVATGGAGTVPTSWTTLRTVSGQSLSSFTLLVDLTGYSWMRILVTGNSFAPPPGSPGIDLQLDVRDARNGTGDTFKFFGDSITANCMSVGVPANFSALVNAGSPSHVPAFENAGIGGWSSASLLSRFDEWLVNYPGRHVGISMGTNDANGDLSGASAAAFYTRMLTMVDKVLAAGKVPIVPTIPWASLAQYRDAIPHYNAKIVQLYAARPAVVRGPDLWTYFQSNPAYLTSGDGLHPTAAGCAQMRQLWANAALSNIYGGTPVSMPAGPAPTSAPIATPTPPAAPVVEGPLVWGCCGVTSTAAAAPATITAGSGETTVTASIRLGLAARVLIDVEVYDPNGSRVVQKVYDNEAFAAGETRAFTATYVPSPTALGGSYTIRTGVFAPAWGNLLDWKAGAGTFTVAASGLATPAPAPFTPPAVGAPALSPLRVSGNRLVNAAGTTVQLRGVNRSGTEYACIQGWGFAEGPTTTAGLQPIRDWGANAVRVPLNEGCWLGINGAPAAYSGPAYQRQIADLVTRLGQLGLYTVLEMHWSAPGVGLASGQQPMPDADHSVTFWTQVARTFKDNGTVILDLHNEPYPDNNQDTDAAWTCWRDGGSCRGFTFEAAGMQTLLDAVRATGARNVVALSGVQYANALGGWAAHRPTDPQGNLVAAWHVYDFNACRTKACFDLTVGPLAASVPVLALEFGSHTCDRDWLTMTMDWFDAHGLGYFAWTWNKWGTACSALALITDDAGTPTVWGTIYRERLGGRPVPVPPVGQPTAAAATPATSTPTSAVGVAPPTLGINFPAAGQPATAAPVASVGARAADNSSLVSRGGAGAVGGSGPPQVAPQVAAAAAATVTVPVAAVKQAPRHVPGAPAPAPLPPGAVVPLAVTEVSAAALTLPAEAAPGGPQLALAAAKEMLGVLTRETPEAGASLSTLIGPDRAAEVMRVLAATGEWYQARSEADNALAAVVGLGLLSLALSGRLLAAVLRRRRSATI